MTEFLKGYGFQVVCVILACFLIVLKLVLGVQDDVADMAVGALLAAAGVIGVKQVVSKTGGATNDTQ